MYRSPIKSKYAPSKTIKSDQKSGGSDPLATATGFNQITKLVQELTNMKEEAKQAIDEHISRHEDRMNALNDKIDKATQVLERAKNIQKGDKGDLPKAGIDFPIPQDGNTPDPEDIAPYVVPLVLKALPKIKDGETPIKDVHYFDGEDGDDGINPDPEDVIKLIKEKQLLRPEHIEGFHQTVRSLFEQLDKAPGRAYLHGGGDTVKAGTNITLTRNSDGTTSISTPGGAGIIYTDTVSGTINGSNKVFTVANTISTAMALHLGNSVYQPTVDFTVSGTNITFITAPDASLSGQPFWLLHT